MNVLVESPHDQRCERVLRTIWNGIWWTTPKRNGFIVCVRGTLWWVKPRRVCARTLLVLYYAPIHRHNCSTILYTGRGDVVVTVWSNERIKRIFRPKSCDAANEIHSVGFQPLPCMCVHIVLLSNFFVDDLVSDFLLSVCAIWHAEPHCVHVCVCRYSTHFFCKQQQPKRAKIKRFY